MISRIKGFVGLTRFAFKHPLCRGRFLSTLCRIVGWQIASRLVPGAFVVPFTSSTKLMMRPAMHGATGNYYFGLDEFEDMAFVIHLLRRGDLFVDIGANIGSYTILASGHVGANSIAVEPVPQTFEHLKANVRINNLDAQVTLHNVGIGEAEGVLRFTAHLDSVNHVVSNDEVVNSIEVPIRTLDSLLHARAPKCIKIDVEGYERSVLNGAEAVLGCNEIDAVLLELNGSGVKYGYSDGETHGVMLKLGFTPCRYEPFSRRLTELTEVHFQGGNTLYVKNISRVRDRLTNAPEVHLPWRKF